MRGVFCKFLTYGEKFIKLEHFVMVVMKHFPYIFILKAPTNFSDAFVGRGIAAAAEK